MGKVEVLWKIILYNHKSLKLSFSKHHIYDWFFFINSFSGEGQFRNFINPVIIVTIIYGCSQQLYVIKFNVMFLWHVFYENSYIFFCNFHWRCWNRLNKESQNIGKWFWVSYIYVRMYIIYICWNYNLLLTVLTYCWLLVKL